MYSSTPCVEPPAQVELAPGHKGVISVPPDTLDKVIFLVIPQEADEIVSPTPI